MTASAGCFLAMTHIPVHRWLQYIHTRELLCNHSRWSFPCNRMSKGLSALLQGNAWYSCPGRGDCWLFAFPAQISPAGRSLKLEGVHSWARAGIATAISPGSRRKPASFYNVQWQFFRLLEIDFHVTLNHDNKKIRQTFPQTHVRSSDAIPRPTFQGRGWETPSEMTDLSFKVSAFCYTLLPLGCLFK